VRVSTVAQQPIRGMSLPFTIHSELMISAQPDTITASLFADQSKAQSVLLCNNSPQSLQFSITPNSPEVTAISVSPSSGTLASMQSHYVDVHFSSVGLQPGMTEQTFTIRCTDTAADTSFFVAELVVKSPHSNRIVGVGQSWGTISHSSNFTAKKLILGSPLTGTAQGETYKLTIH